MSTFFGKIPPFEEIPDDQQIVTKTFLESCKHCTAMFDLFGTVFKIVRSDMNGNIESLLKKHNTNPLKYRTLNTLLPDDEYQGKHAGISALWLKRGLEYIYVFLTEMVKDSRDNINSEDVVPMARVAYEKTLKPYHGWWAQQGFSMITKFAPYKADLLHGLAFKCKNMDDQVITDLENYLPLLDQNIRVFDTLIKNLGFDNDDKV